ncbi:hypothetical protein A1D31_14205 [Bradyrhizobium liaoningense]|nr:hypothetical protein A1D31_14205 [Bradyrhizobium liaoningense]
MADFNAKTATPDTDGPADDNSVLFGADGQAAATPKVYSFGGIKAWIKAFLAGQLPATATNDNANAGNVGEYVEGVLAAGAATGLTSGASKTIVSIPLAAGDWEIEAVANILPAATTSVTNNAASLSLVNNTLDGTPGRFVQFPMAAVVPGSVTMSVPIPACRFNLPTPATVYLVAASTFTASTNFAYGIIRARRPR